MDVVCRVKESTFDIQPIGSETYLVVESDMWPAIDVKLSFKGVSIKVNAEQLKKAIDNCCNI